MAALATITLAASLMGGGAFIALDGSRLGRIMLIAGCIITAAAIII